MSASKTSWAVASPSEQGLELLGTGTMTSSMMVLALAACSTEMPAGGATTDRSHGLRMQRCPLIDALGADVSVTAGLADGLEKQGLVNGSDALAGGDVVEERGTRS